MVEEHRVLPVDLCMAVFTLRPKRTLVNIVIEVTRVACRRQLNFKYWLDMAVNADDFLVRPVEDKVRVVIMIKMRRRPISAAVAGIALGAALTCMLVVLKVAGDAGSFEFVFEGRVRVTVVADQACVLAVQRKVRVPAVIETGIVPVGRIVTPLALRAAAAVVRIVLCMAAVTVRRRIRESMILVAIQADDLLMFADQGIVRCVMGIEWGKCSSLVMVKSEPRPTPIDVVLHSPTPSKVTTAASSKGEQK